MDHIWEALLDGTKDIFFQQSKIFSPYYETSPDNLIGTDNGKSVVSFNSLYRFEKIFAPFFSEEAQDGEWKEYLFDILVHVLSNIDLKEGFTRKEYQIRHIMTQINEGYFGSVAKGKYVFLSKRNQYTLAQYVFEQQYMGASVTLFGKAIIQLLDTGVIYKNKVLPKTLLLYVGSEKTTDYEIIVNLAERFFLPLDYTLRVFWNTHFALLGEKQTMDCEQIEIF